MGERISGLSAGSFWPLTGVMMEPVPVQDPAPAAGGAGEPGGEAVWWPRPMTDDEGDEIAAAGSAPDGQATAAGITDAGGLDPDLVLVRAIAGGDERALRTLLTRHGPRLRALAGSYSAAAGDADDVVQDTMWTIWRTAARFEARGVKVASWITRIAVNRCIDLERRRRIRRFVGLEDAAEAPDPAIAADEALAGRKRLAAVLGDIRSLPPRQRAAILIAAGGEQSTADIAASLGVSVGAAEQLLVRARRTLRQNLARREGENR